MSQDGARALGFVVATVALVLVVVVFGGTLLGAASGPENELITALKRAEQPGTAFDASGRLVGQKVSYQRLSVLVAEDGASAVVTGTLDFTGHRDDIAVSSLGFERVKFVRDGADWRPVEGLAPRLSAIVRALERRRRALERGEIPAAVGLDEAEAERYRRLEGRRFEVQAWFIRSERDEVEVAEDYRLRGTLPERPVDERATRRLSLKQEPSGEFLFPRGLL